ncbi:MFS general substrate transporter [Exidia glandulosa HHB12029]|uniref:MFS general substrate transporter n=1 Tax=Exidia glandulosa HHB12029 TaxID=1314781 RepID=A0A165QRA7_EXIGL|nr:MFS general substrate transporter [Exidia glandulosa HHB12029]
MSATAIHEQEKRSSSLGDEEKRPDRVGVETAVESVDGDEALKLVGLERADIFTEEYNAKLRRKLDWVIPPVCAAVYFTQFLDKTSLNYASIMGFPIVGSRYNLVSLAFYAGFLVCAHATMDGVNVILWGVVLMCHAATTSFGGLFALRFLLGMLESCVAPTLVLIISSSAGKRIAWFYFMNGMTQVFGGFVAYGISFYSGTQFVSYQIVFILLGGLAILVGIAVLLWLPDSPVYAKFLTKEERIAVLERVRNDQGGTENKHFKKEQVYEALKDLRTWLVVLTVLTTSIPNGALSNFSNIIIKVRSSRQTLIISTPGGVIAALTTLGCGYWSDKRKDRMMPIVAALVPTILGSALLIGFNGDKNQKGVLLFGVYLIGTFGSALAIVYAWNASNVRHLSSSRSASGVSIIFSDRRSYEEIVAGNIVGTEIFQAKDAPDYIPGKIAILVLLTVQIFICFALRFLNIRLNKKKAAQLEAEKVKRGWTDDDIRRERERHAFVDMTDGQNMFFVYTT